MITLFLIRHAPTLWNQERRLQGHADIPLCKEGKEEAAKWKFNHKYTNLWSSPLKRAVETSEIVFGIKPTIEHSLIEMNWGNWEGSTLEKLRSRYGDKMKEEEKLGINMKPDGGESPREVQERLKNWYSKIVNFNESHIAITHKGVIRAMIALATDWDMISKPPVKLDLGFAYKFQISDKNKIFFLERLSLKQANE